MHLQKKNTLHCRRIRLAFQLAISFTWHVSKTLVSTTFYFRFLGEKVARAERNVTVQRASAVIAPARSADEMLRIGAGPELKRCNFGSRVLEMCVRMWWWRRIDRYVGVFLSVIVFFFLYNDAFELYVEFGKFMVEVCKFDWWVEFFWRLVFFFYWKKIIFDVW